MQRYTQTSIYVYRSDRSHSDHDCWSPPWDLIRERTFDTLTLVFSLHFLFVVRKLSKGGHSSTWLTHHLSNSRGVSSGGRVLPWLLCNRLWWWSWTSPDLLCPCTHKTPRVKLWTYKPALTYWSSLIRFQCSDSPYLQFDLLPIELNRPDFKVDSWNTTETQTDHFLSRHHQNTVHTQTHTGYGCIYIHVCIHVCMYVYIYLSIYLYLSISLYLYLSIYDILNSTPVRCARCVWF